MNNIKFIKPLFDPIYFKHVFDTQINHELHKVFSSVIHDFIMITCINAGENTTLGVSVAEPSDHRKLSFENVTKYWIKVS